MSIIGILTCEILELEFACLLAADSDIGQITVIADARSARLTEALESAGVRNFRRIPHIRGFCREPSDRTEVLIRVLELALHRKREILQDALFRAAHEMSHRVDALFLGYGLCGNALDNPVELLDVDVPVFIPMDKDHPVDDCVGLLIGGREIYYGEQKKIPGTFFMIPGWTYHWKKLFDEDFGNAGQDMAKRLLPKYERALLVSTPAMPIEKMEQNIAEFNHLFNLRVEKREGTIDILTRTWNAAKLNLVIGDHGAAFADTKVENAAIGGTSEGDIKDFPRADARERRPKYDCRRFEPYKT